MHTFRSFKRSRFLFFQRGEGKPSVQPTPLTEQVSEAGPIARLRDRILGVFTGSLERERSSITIQERLQKTIEAASQGSRAPLHIAFKAMIEHGIEHKTLTPEEVNDFLLKAKRVGIFQDSDIQRITEANHDLSE